MIESYLDDQNFIIKKFSPEINHYSKNVIFYRANKYESPCRTILEQIYQSDYKGDGKFSNLRGTCVLVNMVRTYTGHTLFRETSPFLSKYLQGQQGLSAHFEMALTGRKKVAMSKLIVPSNSQQKNNFRHMVSFYVPIKPWPQQPHKVQVY